MLDAGRRRLRALSQPPAHGSGAHINPPATIIGVAVAALAAAAGTLGETFQLVTLAVGLAVALAVGRSKRKDAIIADLEKSEARLEKGLEGAAARADREHERRRELEAECATWRGKYEEQSRYTAREALEQVIKELAAIRATFGEAITNQGELILKNTELAAGGLRELEHVVKNQGELIAALASVKRSIEDVAEDVAP